MGYGWTFSDRVICWVDGAGVWRMRMGGDSEEKGIEVKVIVGWDAFIEPETVEPVRTGFSGADHDEMDGGRRK